MKGGALSPTLRQRLLGYAERRPRLGPETVHIDIANACNLDCVTCWNHAAGLEQPKSDTWKQQRMAAPTFHRVLDEVAATDAERIIISGGGEPFMHPRILEFIAAVKERGLALTVISNGTLCDFGRLVELGVDQMLINMSSASAETYVAYHPNQSVDTFERLIDGIASVRGRIAINLVEVVNALNAHELVAMVELAARLGTRASFKLGDTPPGTELCALNDAQRQILLAVAVRAARERADRLDVRHNLDAFAGQLAQTTATASEMAPPPCFAGYLYSRVFVDGRVFFCCEHIEVGNIDEASFGDIWRAEAYDAVRRRLHQSRGYPGCARCGKHDMNFTAERQYARLEAEQAQP